MIYKIKRFLTVLLFSSISFISFGVDPGPPPPPPCPPTGDPNVVGSPIEDGISVILGLALFYGAFKLQQARRKLKETENKA
jgi:hypothetical protein